jgi:hypothetical protein
VANIVPTPKTAERMNTICAPKTKELAVLPVGSFAISPRSPTDPPAIIIEVIIAVAAAIANS